MLKTISLYICLAAFLLQSTLFNIVLFGCISFIKTLESDFGEATSTVTLTQTQYQNLKWLNKSEFVFGNYLIDVKNVKKGKDFITISYKIDINEKNFLERLADYLKSKKTFTGTIVFNQFEIPQFNFILPSTICFHKSIIVSITEANFPEDSPPPKA